MRRTRSRSWVTAQAAVALPLALLAGIASLLAWQPATAQTPPVEVEVEADHQQVTVGDHITLTVFVRHEEGMTLELPSLGEAFGELELVGVEPTEQRTLRDRRLETRLRYVVAAFRTGRLEVPPLQVTYTDAAGNRGTASSQAVPIAVESVLPPGREFGDIRGLKPQLSIPGGTPLWVMPLVASGAVVGAMLVVAFARWWMRRPRVRQRPASPAPPPEDIARRQLDGIASLGFVRADDYGSHYHRLSACLRRYVSDRYRFPAFAFTTAELEDKMTSRGVDRWQARLIAALLHECDRVQFGQYRPAAARAEADLTAAYEILELTRPETADVIEVDQERASP